MNFQWIHMLNLMSAHDVRPYVSYMPISTAITTLHGKMQALDWLIFRGYW